MRSCLAAVRPMVPILLALLMAAPVSTPRGARADEPAADVLRDALDLVVDRYWRPEEVQLDELLVAGLQRLERASDRVLVTGPDRDGRCVLAIGEARRAFATTDVADVADLVARMREAMAFVEAQWSEADGEPEDLEVLALQGLLEPLDRHCRVIDKRKLADFEARYRGTLSGIGARIGRRADVLTVVKVYEDSPSLDAGLRAGDVITHIDGVATLNMRVADAIARIRGPEGIAVTLTVHRPGEEGRRVFYLVRRKLVLPTIDETLYEQRYAVMVLDHFSQHTADEFREKLLRLADEAPDELGGVILDLRGNQGGSMLHASRIVDYFTDEGSILVTQGADGSGVKGLRHRVDASADQTLAPWPVVVLVDHKTASGSEILAGGLKFLGRALVIGTQTFGKGTVQKPYELREQLQMKLTVARYLVAEDVWIADVGITPDVALGQLFVDDDGAQFPDVLIDPDVPDELPHADWRPTRGGLNAAPELRMLYPYLAWEGDGHYRPEVEGWQADLGVVLASRILARAGDPSRDALLAAARAVVDEERAVQRARLTDTMNELGVTWSADETRWMDLSPARETADLERMRGEPPADVDVRLDGLELRAGESTEVVLRITNRGEQPRTHLRATSMCQLRALDGRSFLIGDLAPGASASVAVPVRVPARMQTRVDEVRVFVVDDRGPLGGAVRQRVTTWGTASPRFALRVTRDEQPDDDGRMHTYRVEVRNDGAVGSGRLRLSFENPGREGVELQESHRELGELAPGAVDEAQLRVRVLGATADAPLVLRADDPEHRVGTAVQLARADLPAGETSDWFQAPVIHVPAAERPLVGRGSLSLSAVAEDDDGMRRMVVWLGADKLEVFEAADAPGRRSAARRKSLPIEIELPLSEGSQTLRLVAVDSSGIRAERRYAILGESGDGAAAGDD